MQETFADYGIKVKGTGNITTTCPQCSHKRKKKRDQCLSVNVEEGVWFCHHCNWKGSLKMKDEGFEKQPEKRDKGKLQTQALTPQAEKWLNDRGISRETAEAYNLKSCMYYFPALGKEASAIAIPFYDKPEDKNPVNVKIRALEHKAHSQVAGGRQILWNKAGCHEQDTIAITEGEWDALALYEAGWQYGVCSCPNGAPAENCEDYTRKLEFIEDANGIFGNAKEVYLAMDNDAPGVKWQDAIAKKIGAEKCKIPEWSVRCKDANDVLIEHGVPVLQECMKYAKACPVPGIVHISEYRNAVKEYWKSGKKRVGKSTGWEILDDMVKIDTQTLNIVTGTPSSGKSEWLDQLMVHTIKDHGWKWCVYSPENWPIETGHLPKLIEKYIQKPFWDAGGLHGINETEHDAAMHYLDENIKMVKFGEETPNFEDIKTAIKVSVHKWGVKGVIIDPYNEISHPRSNQEREDEYISRFLSELRNFSRVYDLSIWIVAHPKKLQKIQEGKHKGDYPVARPYDISGAAHWFNKADLCWSVWRSIARDENQITLYNQKVRNKNLGSPGQVQFSWDWRTGLFTAKL